LTSAVKDSAGTCSPAHPGVSATAGAFEPVAVPRAPNMGKIQRLIRELVAVLVDELGPEDAARMLEHALGQVRGAGYRPTQATRQQDGRLRTGRKRA
jgi:hypothetical protein